MRLRPNPTNVTNAPNCYHWILLFVLWAENAREGKEQADTQLRPRPK